MTGQTTAAAQTVISAVKSTKNHSGNNDLTGSQP
jgi:hypothetical protein